MSTRISGRTWISIITIIFLVVALFLARHEIETAYDLLDQANLWILLLLVPLQVLSYYAAGEIIFSYLKKQKHMHKIGAPTLIRLALEMNFVNHILPSGGVSGVSYMGWRLKKFGVSASRSTAAQIVRMVATFGAYAVLLVAAVIVIMYDGAINRWVVGATIGLIAVMAGALFAVAYLLSHKSRLKSFSRKLVSFANGFRRAVGSDKRYTTQPIDSFFAEVQEDYQLIRSNKKTLIVPFLWGFVFNIAEVAMFYVAFLALGHVVNPAPIVIAFGLAGMAGFFMVTPGGAGAYEAVMVAFLVAAGINPGIALLGILLARILLLLGTIVTGYVFYQQAIIKYGKRPEPRT